MDTCSTCISHIIPKRGTRKEVHFEMARKFVKELLYVPSLPKDVDKLKVRKTEAVVAIDNAMLECVWQEFNYRLDVCRVTNGAHIEYL